MKTFKNFINEDEKWYDREPRDDHGMWTKGPNVHSVLSAGVDDKRKERLKWALDTLHAGVKDGKIFNVDYKDAKDILNQRLAFAAEKPFREITRRFNADDSHDKTSPHLRVYMADIDSYIALSNAATMTKRIKTFLQNNTDFPPEDKERLEKMLAITEIGVELNNTVKELKDKVVMGRKPNQNVDPNAFRNVVGSAESQKTIRAVLGDGVKRPLDEYEEHIRDMFQGFIDDLAKQTSIKFNKDSSPLKRMTFFRCFTSTRRYIDKGDVYTDIKPNEHAEEYAAKEAKKNRDAIEQNYISKNIRKLSNLIELKGGKVEIEELPYHPPAIAGGTATIQSGFKFKFGDKSEFKVINKVVSKYSYAGTFFQQYPTTFHDVIFPDGSKMKSPSEEKMIKEFAAKK